MTEDGADVIQHSPRSSNWHWNARAKKRDPPRPVDWQDDPRFAASTDCPLHQVDITLFIGGMLGRLRVKEHNIGTIVACLTEDEWYYAPKPPTGVVEYFMCIADTTRLSHDRLHMIVTNGVNAIEEAVARGHRVLVHCMAGISRSSTVVLAYLMKRDCLTFVEALEKLEAVRYCVCPNPAFQKYLKWREKGAVAVK